MSLIDEKRAWLSKALGQFLKVTLDPDQVPLDVELAGSKTPAITNKLIPSANTEVSHAIPDGTKKILIRIRGLATAKIAFTSTESATKFITIPRGATYSTDFLKTSGLSIFLQTNKATQVAEILTWN